MSADSKRTGNFLFWGSQIIKNDIQENFMCG